MQPLSPTRSRSRASDTDSEEGFLLVAVICLAVIILIFLAAAAPTVAKDLQREREIEVIHRGNQYVRAIRLYYRKNGTYPTSIDSLLTSNNIRYLRQEYVDPMTGKPDWRLIHVGENQTQVTCFFGQPFAGVQGTGIAGATGAGQTVSSSTTAPSSTTSSSGSDASAFNGNAGPIMGVSSQSTKASIISIHGQTTYNTWEFLYDPRIEALYNSAQITGGGGGTTICASGAGPAASPSQ
ncbi:MAG TPA: type II secretion system protein [Acidobacteriaceae bacterium]|jgi:type II secretory pathway pseudopilin PulG|nr:type II secretion system protein [Acidobacteriaceae bacterium]